MTSGEDDPDTLVIMTVIVPLSLAPNLMEAMHNYLREQHVDAVNGKADMYILRASLAGS